MKKTDTTESSHYDPEKIKALASQAANVASKFIKKHPIESVAGAMALGLVIGLLINRK